MVEDPAANPTQIQQDASTVNCGKDQSDEPAENPVFSPLHSSPLQPVDSPLQDSSTEAADSGRSYPEVDSVGDMVGTKDKDDSNPVSWRYINPYSMYKLPKLLDSI